MMDLYVLSGDNVVAQYKNNKFAVINKALCPSYLLRTGNIEGWLESRAIDSHRANSRLLKKALRLKERDDISTVLFTNAVTITDNYWVRELDSQLRYSDVKFTADYFSNLALTGSYDSFNKAVKAKNKRTPELTNIGSYEKCWKLKKGEWWMYKKANHNQLFSELFAFELGKNLGFNMAEYERGKGFVKTKDFTGGKVNFEPMHSFVGDDEDYEVVYNALCEICPLAIEDYVKMIYLDTLIANVDRHTFNMGLIRNNEGKFIGLAPNFDNNRALISNGYPQNIKRNRDLLIELFVDFIRDKRELGKYIVEINERDIKNILDKLEMKVRSKVIVDFIINGYNEIIKGLKG